MNTVSFFVLNAENPYKNLRKRLHKILESGILIIVKSHEALS
jgi:hypothetical protein